MSHLHLSFTTPDLAATTAFYTRMLGLEPDKVRQDYVRFTVANPPLVLALREGPAAPLGHGIDHLGIRLADVAAVQAAKARVEAAGLETRTEDAVSCCYAVQDKVWVADPDGRPWELYTVTGEAEVLVPEQSDCCVPGVQTTEVAAASSPTGCCG